MFRQKLFSIGAALLASAAMLFSSAPVLAAGHGGGGHGGGGRGGGGYHGGGYRGGGYRGGGYRGYGYGGRGYYGRGYYGGWGLGYGGWGYPYYYGSYGYPDYYSDYGSTPDVYQSFYTPQVTAPVFPVANNTVMLNVAVPADATVLINGQPTTQTGQNRQYVSPQLTPGKTYSYEVTARWSENGQPVERTRTVKFEAGSQVAVNFLQ
jgi:uncharacterized protein (TIGR03000 family)